MTTVSTLCQQHNTIPRLLAFATKLWANSEHIHILWGDREAMIKQGFEVLELFAKEPVEDVAFFVKQATREFQKTHAAASKMVEKTSISLSALQGLRNQINALYDRT